MLTVAGLCNTFLSHKEALQDPGELAPRTFRRYFLTCKTLTDTWGRDRLVADLHPADFQRLRTKMAAVWGPVALGNEIQIVRSVFKFGFDSELLDKPVRFGPGFK